MENIILLHKSICSMYVYIYMLYIHNPESALKILQMQLKKVNDCLGKPTINMLDSSMMKKTASDMKPKG